jgi:hypothetical protein
VVHRHLADFINIDPVHKQPPSCESAIDRSINGAHPTPSSQASRRHGPNNIFFQQPWPQSKVILATPLPLFSCFNGTPSV